jgi:sporulation protein YlmC with PRC-barrel domain
MPARHSLIVLAALLPIGVSLAQDGETTSSIAPETRATAAFPVRQDARQWLGLNLIGAKVVSVTGQTIGRVSNLILDENGTVASAVIEVGGLLGFGSKSVAVTYQSLNIVRNKKGDAIDHVTVAATKDDLLHAAGFKSLRQQTADAQGKR